MTSSLSQISVQFQIQPLTWVNPSWALNPFLWETTSLAQISYLHHVTGDTGAVICLYKTNVSSQPPRSTDLLLGQIPFCSIALWDVTHAL